MNAPVLILAVEPEVVTPATLGTELFEGAQRREVALSDAQGCRAFLSYAHPVLARRTIKAARRLAIDLQGQAARDPNGRLVAACRAALARAEQVAEEATLAEAHVALAEVSDLIATALAEVAPSL